MFLVNDSNENLHLGAQDCSRIVSFALTIALRGATTHSGMREPTLRTGHSAPPPPLFCNTLVSAQTAAQTLVQCVRTCTHATTA
jgi:hypothetical protein